MTTIQTNNASEKGFTLVELAIVLVIIGLIVGGVLAGQDLIRQATIRNAQTQIQNYNTAATTFQAKYNALPGDIVAATATAAAFTPVGNTTVTTFTGAAGLRDGNGLIQNTTAANYPAESILFWTDLTSASLIPTSVQGAAASTGPNAAMTAANMNTFMPTLRLRNTAGVTVFAGSPGNITYAGNNHFIIANWTGSPVNGPATPAPAMTPLEASAFDAKFDDGQPLTGTVTALGSTAATGWTVAAFGPVISVVPAAATATTCLTNAASPGAYNIATTGPTAGGNGVNCTVAVRAQF